MSRRLFTAAIRHRTLRAPPPPPIKHAAGDRQSSAIYQLRSSAGPDTRFHQKPPASRSEGIWRGPGVRQMRHDDEAQLGGVTFDGRRLPSIRHFRAGNPDGRLIRPVPLSSRLFASRAAQSDKFTPSVRESQRPVDRPQVPVASKLRQIYSVFFVINSRRPVVPMSTYTTHRGRFTRFFLRATISHRS